MKVARELPHTSMDTQDGKRIEMQHLPGGQRMIVTWASNKAPQSYFVLSEEMWNTMQEVLDNKEGMSNA